jgi:hypothetical protein
MYSQNIELLKEYHTLVEGIKPDCDIVKFKKGKPLYKGMFEDMEEIEEQLYSGDAQDIEDIEDDFIQPGFGGHALINKEGRIVGYNYGYAFIFEDNLEPMIDYLSFDDLNDMRFYDEDFKNRLFEEYQNGMRRFKKFLKKTFKNKSFYGSNFVILPEYRDLNAYFLVSEGYKLVKEMGYEYIFGDAKEDTQRVFGMNDDKKFYRRTGNFGWKPFLFFNDGSDRPTFILKSL